MKKRVTMSMVILVMLVGGVSLAAAHGRGWGGGGCGPGMNLEHMAQKLNLTETQKEKVSAIVKAEQDKTESLRKQLAENREQFRKAGFSEKFDEAAVRTIAEKQSRLRTEMMVSHAKAKSEIYALLTPEQRALADKFVPRNGPGAGGRMGRCWDEE